MNSGISLEPQCPGSTVFISLFRAVLSILLSLFYFFHGTRPNNSLIQFRRDPLSCLSLSILPPSGKYRSAQMVCTGFICLGGWITEHKDVKEFSLFLYPSPSSLTFCPFISCRSIWNIWPSFRITLVVLTLRFMTTLSSIIFLFSQHAKYYGWIVLN